MSFSENPFAEDGPALDEPIRDVALPPPFPTASAPVGAVAPPHFTLPVCPMGASVPRSPSPPNTHTDSDADSLCMDEHARPASALTECEAPVYTENYEQLRHELQRSATAWDAEQTSMDAELRRALGHSDALRARVQSAVQAGVAWEEEEEEKEKEKRKKGTVAASPAAAASHATHTSHDDDDDDSGDADGWDGTGEETVRRMLAAAAHARDDECAALYTRAGATTTTTTAAACGDVARAVARALQYTTALIDDHLSCGALHDAGQEDRSDGCASDTNDTGDRSDCSDCDCDYDCDCAVDWVERDTTRRNLKEGGRAPDEMHDSGTIGSPARAENVIDAQELTAALATLCPSRRRSGPCQRRAGADNSDTVCDVSEPETALVQSVVHRLGQSIAAVARLHADEDRLRQTVQREERALYAMSLRAVQLAACVRQSFLDDGAGGHDRSPPDPSLADTDGADRVENGEGPTPRRWSASSSAVAAMDLCGEHAAVHSADRTAWRRAHDAMQGELEQLGEMMSSLLQRPHRREEEEEEEKEAMAAAVTSVVADDEGVAQDVLALTCAALHRRADEVHRVNESMARDIHSYRAALAHAHDEQYRLVHTTAPPPHTKSHDAVAPESGRVGHRRRSRALDDMDAVLRARASRMQTLAEACAYETNRTDPMMAVYDAAMERELLVSVQRVLHTAVAGWTAWLAPLQRVTAVLMWAVEVLTAVRVGSVGGVSMHTASQAVQHQLDEVLRAEMAGMGSYTNRHYGHHHHHHHHTVTDTDDRRSSDLLDGSGAMGDGRRGQDEEEEEEEEEKEEEKEERVRQTQTEMVAALVSPRVGALRALCNALRACIRDDDSLCTEKVEGDGNAAAVAVAAASPERDARYDAVTEDTTDGADGTLREENTICQSNDACVMLCEPDVRYVADAAAAALCDTARTATARVVAACHAYRRQQRRRRLARLRQHGAPQRSRGGTSQQMDVPWEDRSSALREQCAEEERRVGALEAQLLLRGVPVEELQ